MSVKLNIKNAFYYRAKWKTGYGDKGVKTKLESMKIKFLTSTFKVTRIRRARSAKTKKHNCEVFRREAFNENNF